MNLRSKRRLAADVLGVGKDRIIFDPEAQDLIQDAITRSTIRGLAGLGGDQGGPGAGHLEREGQDQAQEGQVSGPRARSGAPRLQGPRGRQAWVMKVRALRWRLKVARERNEISKDQYRKLYRQVKGRPGQGSEAPDRDDEGVAAIEMADYVPMYRRRRSGATNYGARRKAISSRGTLLAVRISNKNVSAQFLKPTVTGRPGPRIRTLHASRSSAGRAR